MKKQIKAVLVVSACGLVAGALGAWGAPRAQEGEAQQPADKPATCPAFEQLKTLAGEWTMPDDNGDGTPDATVQYKVISGGSVVMETLFSGTPHEMVTMYHMNGPDLLVTHYCAAGNQPRMKAKSTDNAKTIDFAFQDGTNMDPATDMYMGALTVTFADENHFTQRWTHFENGEAGEPAVFEWTRAEAPDANAN